MGNEEFGDTFGMVKLENVSEKNSKTYFPQYSGKIISDETGKQKMEGERFVKGVIIRFKDGYIHGGQGVEGNSQPAIECGDSQVEYWENGYLHREDGPAIIAEFGDWEEYWDHGKLVYIFQRQPGTAKEEK
jgi:hypothetical protein